MDLVVGATGILGQAIVMGLRAAGRDVRALVRESSDADKVAALEAAGAETVRGDLKDPASLHAACAGITNVISTASSTLSRGEGDHIESVDRHGHLALVDAIKDAGVRHFVFISFPDVKPANPLQDAKRAVEAAIREAGISYTILQPTIFWEVWASPALGFDVANAKVRIFGAGEGRVSWISLFDVKAAVIASLDNPAVENRTVLLGGPEVLTQNEIVARFEKATGKTFEREVVPLEALQAGYDNAEDPLTKSFSALMINCANGGWEFDMAEEREALGIPLTSIDTYVEFVLGS